MRNKRGRDSRAENKRRNGWREVNERNSLKETEEGEEERGSVDEKEVA